MIPEVKQRIEQIHRGEIPEGYKKAKVGIVPREWKESHLSNYLVVSSEKNQKLKYTKKDVFSISGELGIVNQIEFLGRSYAGASVAPYGIVYPNDIVYTKSPLKANPYGIIKTNKTGKVGLVSTLYAVFHCKNNVSPNFVQYYFELDQNLNNYLYPIVNIGAKHDMKISDENSLRGWVVFPSLSEQKKIAEILFTQDKLITLKEKLIEEKKRQKKYLMQQLITGKQRLPGFNRKWRKLLFKECIMEVDNRSSKNNQYPILSVTKDGIAYQADHFNKQIASDNNVGYKIIRRNQLAFSILNLWMGSVDVLHLCDIGIISPAYKVFECIENYLIPAFAKYFLRSYNVVWLYNINSETGASVVRKNLNLSALLNEQLTIPSIKEQEAIANILDTADKEISMLQRDLDQEKQKKKALMQLLLTGIVRVL